jgi:shikimate kinase
MIVAFFGVTCVGKTTIGRYVAEELGYSFFDLDEEMKLYYNDTILNIQRGCFGDGIDTKKGIVLKDILDRCGDNAVIAISPIYYTTKYRKPFRDKNVLSIVLHDSPENIADRMIYTDDNDEVIEIPDLDIKEEIRDVKYFISRYKKGFNRIESHYDVNGKDPAVAAHEIIKTIIELRKTDS